MNKIFKYIVTLVFLLVSVAATAQVQVGGSVFGGGNLANVTGNSTVTVNQANASIGEDVYGGGALADVKSSSTVNVLNGNVTGNVYGGGLGRKGDDPIAPTVDGVVTVNIGSGTENTTTHFANNDVSGSATIGGSVFGCNNANGSPTDDVFVNIWKTARTTAQQTSGSGYALYQVFGGGNQANYEPSSSNKKTTVHIWTCDNTIQYVYGGGNAADVGTSSTNSATDVIIDGGRIEWVFGGGNGAGASNPGANIFGDVNVDYHAGILTYLFGGSNEKGNISGSKTVNIINDGTCSNNHITELYGGSNLAPITGDVSLTMGCPSNDPVEIGALFGGSRNANITGNVTLTIEGGEYAEVFGGNNIGGTISGDVTLNLFGGTIGSAFGGNNAGGSINGKITVNMLDQGSCSLTVNNIYGGGKNAAYSPTTTGAYPEVNLIHGTVSKNTGVGGNVYGGGYGSSATVTSNPTVNIGYNSTTMTSLVSSLLLPPSTSLTTANVDVKGNVYGGGEEAPVVGSISVTMQQASVSGLTANTNVRGDIYGGGDQADVSGSVVVNVTGGTVTQDVYGGGALADVNVTSGTLTSGATTAVTLSGGQARALYGGGLGSRETGSEVEAKVYGPVTVTVNDGTVTDVFGCNNQYGAPQSTVTVNINNNVAGNVYGGGNLAAYTGTPDVNINAGIVSGSVFGGGNQAGVGGGDVTMTAGTVLTGIYGGCNTSGNVGGGIAVNINGGTIGTDANHTANVHGGGYGSSTTTSGNVVVNIAQEGATAGPTIWGDVYGGSALGSVNSSASTPVVNNNAHTYVTLNKGTVHGDIYGGGLGQTSPSIEAKVWSPVQVTVNAGTVTGSIYGCNNVKGAPQSTVKVDIYGTDAPAPGSYALAHVFGGGNQAAYSNTPEVTIHNCDNSIGYVYGGGNKASVAGTQVKVYGGTIGYVFGGGNGEGVAANYTMVSGNAVAYIYGGTIAQVFGGNNSSGTITGAISVNIDKTTETGHSSCPMKIGEVYGGGNYAAGNAGSITIGCTGEWTTTGTNNHTNHNNSDNRIGYELEGIGTVYGGANRADINNNIVLNINSGIVENVFGGNNTTGNISGTIVVNINKNNNASCANHWYVGYVFGGGNEAPYSNANGYPVVNIVNGAVANNVYGGGKGSGATVTGTPHVNIGYNSDMSSYLPAAATASVVSVGGNVYGGGDQAAVSGGTTVRVQLSSLTGAGTTVSGDVYGGGNLANVSNATTVNVTGGTVTNDVYGGGALANTGGSTVTLSGGTIRNLYGGGLGDATHAAAVSGAVVVNVTGGNATDVFGCNNVNGAPTSSVTVNIEEATSNTMTVTNVYGGGNQAACNITPTVNIKSGTVSGNVYGGGNNILADTEAGTLGVAGSNVQMTGGTVVGKVYGGCNLKGTVTGTSQVTISGGTLGSSTALATGTTSDVFGGGLGENTKVKGNVTVTITRASGDNPPAAPTIWGDVYGGSAKGSVNTNSSNTTTVHILDGILKTNRSSQTIGNQTIYSYTGGNVFGGGLGETNVTDKGKVNGKVFVNIGAGTPHATTPFTVAVTGLGGNATIEGNVYGCNNSGGSPQDDVTVNIFQTNHTSSNGYEGTGYAIANVFGGGNEADYTVSGKTAYVNIYSCVNTIERVFGGGNAAAAPHVATNIQGGRINQVYGGGNGERGSQYGANIGAGIDLTIHGGNVGEFYGGSNQYGTVTGAINTNVVNDGPCESMVIDEFFCGGKYVDINGDLTTTIECSDGMEVHNLYGGCNQAHITGSVVLNVYGGIYTNVYGGSKGDLSSLGEGHTDRAANIGGSVTLNLFGGTMENVFGGSNVNGNINGVIKVNVLDKEDGTCPLNITNIYGGSNMTNYTPSNPNVTSPVVNVMHIRNGVSGNVYGGSKGVEGTTVTLTANPKVNIGYHSSMSGDVPTGTGVPTVPASPRAIIAGSVFGGGDAAQVTGNTEIFLWNRAKVFGNVYGGGNMGVVTGDTKVIVNGANQ